LGYKLEKILVAPRLEFVYSWNRSLFTYHWATFGAPIRVVFVVFVVVNKCCSQKKWDTNWNQKDLTLHLMGPSLLQIRCAKSRWSAVFTLYVVASECCSRKKTCAKESNEKRHVRKNGTWDLNDPYLIAFQGGMALMM
jgi:hypothetical protein